MITKIGTVRYRRWVGSGSRNYEIDVQQVSGTPAAHFVTALQVDADGSPKGYHHEDMHPLSNKQPCFDWLENLGEDSTHGRQQIDGAQGPAFGFTISATSLIDANFPANDTRRYTDASIIPYVVLPKDFPMPAGTAGDGVARHYLGCLAFVVELSNGRSSGAVFADVGPRCGEGSIALALRLGHKPFYSGARFPKLTGLDSKRFFMIVFPNEKLALPLDVATVETRARAAFEAWGGWTGLATALKSVPKETPSGAPDDNVASLTLPPPLGPVEDNPLSTHTLEEPEPRTFAVASATGMEIFDSPGSGNALAVVDKGADVELIERISDTPWYRVLATINGEIREGYAMAPALDRR